MSDTTISLLQVVLTLLGGLFSTAAWVLAWKSKKDRQAAEDRAKALRQDDILAWASCTIKTLRRAHIDMQRNLNSQNVLDLAPLSAEISAAIDVGRLFFKNEQETKPRKSWLHQPYQAIGKTLSVLFKSRRKRYNGENSATRHQDTKPPAYRGYRPLILDSLMAAFKCIEEWPNAEGNKNILLGILNRAARDFVSFAQEEVGRGEAASVLAPAGGISQPFEYYKNNETLFELDNPKCR